MIDFKVQSLANIIQSYIEDDSVIITGNPDDMATILMLNECRFAGTTLVIAAFEGAPPVKMDKDVDDMSRETREVHDRIKGILSSRYYVNLKLLNLSRLGQDSGLLQMGMFDAKGRISKLFPVLMAVCDRLFNTDQEKREAIVSVSITDNDLENISNVTALAQTFPDLQNLDLSRNRIADLRALEGWRWKFRKLQNLKITDNPIETASPEYKQEIVRWFPRLQVLNDVQIRTPDEVDAANQIRKSDQVSPIPISGPDFRDVDQIGEMFLRQFFSLYDKDRTTLADSFYDGQSTHSISINVSAPRPDQPSSAPFAAAIFKQSRNLVKTRSLHGQVSRLFRGVEAIKSLWRGIPATEHPDLTTHTDKYLVDCHPLPGLRDLRTGTQLGVGGLIVMVHGEFEEAVESKLEKVRRSFSRTFVLGPGPPTGPVISVVSDLLVLRAWGSLATGSSAPEPLVVLTQPEAESRQHETLKQLVMGTQMTPEYAKMCLVETGWDLEKAMLAFVANKVRLNSECYKAQTNGFTQSKLPADAFITPALQP